MYIVENKEFKFISIITECSETIWLFLIDYR